MLIPCQRILNQQHEHSVLNLTAEGNLFIFCPFCRINGIVQCVAKQRTQIGVRKGQLFGKRNFDVCTNIQTFHLFAFGCQHHIDNLIVTKPSGTPQNGRIGKLHKIFLCFLSFLFFQKSQHRIQMIAQIVPQGAHLCLLFLQTLIIHFAHLCKGGSLRFLLIICQNQDAVQQHYGRNQGQRQNKHSLK